MDLAASGLTLRLRGRTIPNNVAATAHADEMVGLTNTLVAVDDLVQARDAMIADIVGGMPAGHRRFLLSIKGAEPDWDLPALPSVEALPAVRCRLENLARLDQRKRSSLINRTAHGAATR